MSNRRPLPGVEILSSNYADCSNSFLGMVAKDDRLYVWAKFVDLKTEHEIGNMELNHWTIYNGEHHNYRESDTSFEVKDNQGYIVFSIAYRPKKSGSPIVSIAGYFNSPTSVLILGNHWESDENVYDSKGDFYNCFRKTESNWLQNSEIEIQKISSVF